MDILNGGNYVPKVHLYIYNEGNIFLSRRTFTSFMFPHSVERAYIK